MASDAFSTPAEHAFEEEVATPAEAGPSSMGDAAASLSLDQAFDISNTIKIILDGGYRTIGLQFPDELLPSSVAVYRTLQAAIQPSGAQAYVLADSTYGACCPDILSCLHLPADLLVHYGHACLTPTDAIPVHYVFPRRYVDVSAAAAALQEASKEDLDGKGVVVVWDVAFDWLSESIEREFTALDIPVSFSKITRPSIPSRAPEASCSNVGSHPAPALRALLPPPSHALSDCVLWYLGPESRSLLNLQMTHATNPIYAYEPSRGAWAVHPASSRLLSRRLYALHQAMAADVFGLVVGNIGLASSRELVAELRGALKAKQKKSYTLSVGRLNPAKLANFAEIECFVLIGCAEGGVVDNKDFLAPVITPYELTLALKGKEGAWDPAKWTLDLGSVLADAQAVRTDAEGPQPVNETGEDEELEFSLVTGTYRTKKVFGAADRIEDGVDTAADGVKDLTLRGDFTLAKLESAGSMFLQTRSFQGLEPRYGMDEPAQLEEGRSGIARGYTEEKGRREGGEIV